MNNKLKQKRKELGLTLQEVADYVGVSSGTVSRWESGEIKNMRRDKIAKLGEVLKIDPAELTGWKNVGINNGGNISSFILTTDEYSLIIELRKDEPLSVESISRILAYAQTIKDNKNKNSNSQ